MQFELTKNGLEIIYTNYVMRKQLFRLKFIDEKLEMNMNVYELYTIFI